MKRRRLLLLCLTAAVALGVLVWQRLPPSPEAVRAARISAAGKLIEKGETARAIQELRALLIAHPSSHEAYEALADAYMAEGSYDLAVQPMEMAAALAPDLPHLQCRLAEAYLHSRDRDAAVRSIQSGMKSEPNCARTHLVAGEQWLRDDDLTRALAAFREAIRLAPGAATAYQRAGYVLLELDRPEEAEKVLAEGLRVDPDNIGLHVQMGRFFALRASDLASLARAKEHYVRALIGNPDAAAVKSSLGEVAMQAGKPDEARKWWSDALEENRNDAKALYGLGRLLISSGKRAEGQALIKRYAAVQKFQREMSALRMQTSTRPTRELRLRFARLALDAGQADTAERQLTVLLREYPADRLTRSLQGDLYMLQRRADDAAREYRIAASLPVEPAH